MGSCHMLNKLHGQFTCSTSECPTDGLWACQCLYYTTYAYAAFLLLGRVVPCMYLHESMQFVVRNLLYILIVCSLAFGAWIGYWLSMTETHFVPTPLNSGCFVEAGFLFLCAIYALVTIATVCVAPCLLACGMSHNQVIGIPESA